MTHNLNSNLPHFKVDEFLPPISQWTTWSSLIIFAVAGIGVAAASVIQYRVTVKGQGVIRPVGELRLVQAATEGSVIEFFVKENQSIRQGDRIATIDDSRLQTQKSQLQSNIQQTQLQLVQINAQVTALDQQIAAESNRIDRTVAAAAAELSSRRREYQVKQVTTLTEVAEAAAELRAAQAAFGAAQLKRDRYESVAQSGAIPMNLLEEAQLEAQRQNQTVEAAQARLQRTKTALNPTDAEVVVATEQIAQEQASGQASLAALYKDRQALIQQQIEMKKQLEQSAREQQQVEIDLQHTTVTATADGIITKLNLRNSGQTLRSGEEIAQIIPTDAPLQIKAAVPSQERSKISTGQSVQMRVSACPYPDYGILKGTVDAVSEDTKKTQEDTAPFYEVTIAPESNSLIRGDRQCLIQAGMEGQVEIISREETVLRFLLRKARLIANL